ncbi:MAG: peptide chain release factor N(5)-glutamine methyltransferase [Candidatus Latescibacteria bacterium]|jgi:release factor glutamine methyltransferase|nr:peptide chain release factor N(5)-glutamine methyltransferase [Candidatus Latescibacterota bacterium]
MTYGVERIVDVLQVTSDYFAEKSIESASLNAERLLADVLDVRRIDLNLQFDRCLSDGELDRYREMVRRRASGEPLQYILGETEFYSLGLNVCPSVLIPRPETELLVDLIISRFKDHDSPRIADIGTGSGCIAIALAVNLPGAVIEAVDLSGDALAVAQENVARHGVEDRITCSISDLLSDLGDERLDAVVSNPPYIAQGDFDTLPTEVREYEPVQALFAGDDGLSVMRRLVGEAGVALAGGGLLALEVGAGQADAVRDLVLSEIPDAEIEVHVDLSGIERVVMAQRTG